MPGPTKRHLTQSQKPTARIGKRITEDACLNSPPNQCPPDAVRLGDAGISIAILLVRAVPFGYPRNNPNFRRDFSATVKIAIPYKALRPLGARKQRETRRLLKGSCRTIC